MSMNRSLQDRLPAAAAPPQPLDAEARTLMPVLLAAAGNDTAIVHGGERITHAELADRAARLANGLAARGIGPHDPVALVMRDDPAFVVAFFALAALRAIAVPLDPRFKEAELGFCMRECGVRHVIADADKAGLCRDLMAAADEPVEVVAVGDAGPGVATLESLIHGHAPMALTGAQPDDEAVIQYSAGCTGGAKRVRRTQAQLRFEADSLVATLGLTPEDAICSTIPLFHSYGMGCCMLAALRSGGKLVILEDAHPFVLQRDHALEVLGGERVTVLPTVPFILRLLAEAPGQGDLSALRLCLSAASALPRPTFEAFAQRFGVPIRQLYGCTETGTITANVDDDPWSTWRSVGGPLAGVELKVLDAAHEPVVDGRIGEIAVHSPAMTSGYAGRDALNGEVFADGWYLSNDRGHLDDGGRLHLTARRQLLIDVRGDKVDPIEVEDVLAVHPKVREVVVVGIETGVQGEDMIKAVVVPDGACQERELIRFARERLSNYKVPQMVEFREEIPTSAAGDVLRKYLV
jgi:long-chain acyl-CoA synthetase